MLKQKRFGMYIGMMRKLKKCWKMLLIRWELHLNIESSTLIQNFGIDYELNVKREGRKIMNTIVYNDNNWLFPNQPLKTHDISYDDIQYLLNITLKIVL